MKNTMTKNKNNFAMQLAIYFVPLLIFLYILNAVFPTQSDDLGAGIGGIKAAISSYNTWNGRLGELLRVAFGSYLSTTSWYAPINAVIGAAVLLLSFTVIFARLPRRTLKDASIFCIMLMFVMFDPIFSFGSVFYWAAGSFNYLWIWLLLLLWILPYRLYWQEKFSSATKEPSTAAAHTDIGKSIAVFIVGFFAGWGCEFGIVFIVVTVCFMLYSFFGRKEKLPLWFYCGIIGLCAGWCMLYASPGTHYRADLFDEYLSLSQILHLPIPQMFDRLLTVFYYNKFPLYETYLFIMLILILLTVFYKNDFKSMLILLVLTLPALVLIGIPKRIIPEGAGIGNAARPTFFFYLYLIPLFLVFAHRFKNKNENIRTILIIMACLLFALFLFFGSCIQILGIPKRARFQITLINFIFIALSMHICFEHFREKKRICRIAFACCAFLSFSMASFVGFECIAMSRKWDKMVESVQRQKAQGIKNIVVDKNTFRSRYWSYGDWGNPLGIENINNWPNTSYAQHFSVDSFVAE